jgi:hypothetical protein
MRTRYSFYNFLVSIIASIALPLIGFIKVRLFIDLYGSDLNGLQLTMAQVITYLNVCELAFSLAFRQLLFKPLADGDNQKVLQIYHSAKKLFKTVGWVVIIGGIAIGFIFPLFSTSPINYWQTVITFVILSIPFGLSYFMMGPNFVIIADQKEYKINIWIQLIAIIRMLLMIAVILLKLPYMMIFVIEGLQVFIANLLARKIALKNYPWLKEEVNITTEDDSFRENSKYTIIQRVATLATTNTDNIVIAAFMGYQMVSIYGNFCYLTNSVSRIINSAITSPINSFGNLFNDENGDSYSVFTEFLNFAVYIASIISIGVFVVMGRFLQIWMNYRPEYTVTSLMAVLFALNIFYLTIREPIIICRDANGLFKDAKNNAYAQAITKIVLSLILIRVWGIVGILVSTLITNWTVDFLYNPILVYKKVFKLNPLRYYKMIFSRLLIAIFVGFGCYQIWDMMAIYVNESALHFFIGVIIIGIIILVVMTVIYVVAYQSFRNLIKRFSGILIRRRDAKKAN